MTASSNPAPPKQAAPGASVPVRELPANREESRKEDIPFAGPSFLGLSGSNGGGSAEYLLEDESSSSGHGKMYFALLILVIAGALLGWRLYFGDFPWQSRVNSPATATSTTAQSSTPANAPTATPQTNPVPATPNPTDTANTQNSQPATPQQADNSGTQTAADASAKNSDTADKTPSAGAAQTSEPSAENQNTEKPAAPEPAKSAQLKETSPAPKATPKKVAMTEQDSATSEGEALLTQGERYLYGNGVTANCGRAQSSLQAAAEHGNAQALSDLGTMYSTGHCVKQDLPTAYRWFVKALHQQPSNTRISDDLQVLWNQMTPEQKQLAMKTR